MMITTDPDDPKFREALREIGAPEWFPQDAPRHVVTGVSEQREDGTWLSKLVCQICEWEKHIVSGDEGSIKTVNEGDKWAIHSGSTSQDLLQVTKIEVRQDEMPDVFTNFLEGLDDA